MSENIKRINRELKFKGSILEFYQDTMEINGDHTAVWDFIHHKGAAAVVPVLEDGRILMVRQYRNALERETLEYRPERWMRRTSRGLSVRCGSWKRKRDTVTTHWNI